MTFKRSKCQMMYEKSKKVFLHDTNILRNTNTFKESGQILALGIEI